MQELVKYKGQYVMLSTVRFSAIQLDLIQFEILSYTKKFLFMKLIKV